MKVNFKRDFSELGENVGKIGEEYEGFSKKLCLEEKFKLDNELR